MKLTNLKLIYAIIFQYTAYFFIPKFAVSLRIFTSLWEMIQCKLYLSRTVICCHFRAAIYANRHYLALYQNWHKERLAKNGELKPQIIGDVYIHPTADVHPTAVVCIWLVYASVCMQIHCLRTTCAVQLSKFQKHDYRPKHTQIIQWSLKMLIGTWIAQGKDNKAPAFLCESYYVSTLYMSTLSFCC